MTIKAAIKIFFAMENKLLKSLYFDDLNMFKDLIPILYPCLIPKYLIEKLNMANDKIISKMGVAEYKVIWNLARVIVLIIRSKKIGKIVL